MKGRGKRKEERGKQKTKRQNKHFFFLIFFLFLFPLSSPLFPCCAAQSAQQVRATAKAMKNKIKIGDELRYLVQVERPRNYTVLPLTEKVPLAPFEVKRIDAVPARTGENRVKETFGMTLTIFELGKFIIPSIPVQYKDEKGNLGEVLTGPVPVEVVSVGKKLTDKDDIRPIKGPVSLGLGRLRDNLLGILTGILAAVLLVKIIRRKIREAREAESRKPPHERVKIELARLNDQGLLADKKIKEHYSGLSDILRNYMERAWRLEALERTTFEIVEEMKQKNFDPAVTGKIKHVLEETDLVKFAKYTPDRTLADRLEAEILEAVESTRPGDKKT